MDDALGLREELLLDDLIVGGVLEELKQTRVIDVHGVEEHAELFELLLRCDVVDRLELHVLLVHLLMDLADKVKDISHAILKVFEVLLFLIFIGNLHASLEVSNDLLVGDFSGLVHLIIREESEPRLLQTTGLTALNSNSDEWLVRVREESLVVFELIFVEFAVVEVCDLCDPVLFVEGRHVVFLLILPYDSRGAL